MKRKFSLVAVMMLTISVLAASLPNNQVERHSVDSTLSTEEDASVLSEAENINGEKITNTIAANVEDTTALVLASIEENEIEDEEVVETVTVHKVDEIYYAAADVLNVREQPDITSGIVTQVNKNDEVHVTGEVTEKEKTDWVQIEIDGQPAYVVAKYLSKEQQEELIEENNRNWDGQVLDANLGKVYGPSGYETYYNLKMDGCMKILRDMGIQGEYWVRDDGVKMYGDYVMVAADLNKHPRGSLVETSVGIGIVCDTGDFTTNGSGVNIDVAVTWE